MGLPAEKLTSYDDLLGLPENLVGEIIYGQLYTHPRPAPKHALAASSIGGELFTPFQKGKDGGWWILDEPELHISEHVLVPDLAAWRKERMPALPETAWFEVIPDWVCEVLSPSTARTDRIEKMPVYAKLGVAFCWLIDPILQTLEVYRLHEGQWLLQQSLKDDEMVAAEPFADHKFCLNSFWE
ncbi:MAG: Uma2 family endonuclease [Methylococcales bacterium]